MTTLPTGALSLIMVLAGIGIPVMAALNGGLGARLGNPVQAATLLFSLALASSAIVLLLHPKPVVLEFDAIPRHYFLGGLIVAFYVLAMTFIAPKIGVGSAIVLVLLGQVLASAAIDHFGWLGATQSPLSTPRGLGLCMIGIGVLLSRGSINS